MMRMPNRWLWKTWAQKQKSKGRAAKPLCSSSCWNC
jgi:hypothetical protein